MNSKTATSLAVTVITLAAIFVLLLAMRATRVILAPILLAFVLSICATPIENWFLERRIPSRLALLLTIILVVIFILGIALLVASSLQDFSESIPTYDERLEQIEHSLGELLGNLGLDMRELTAGDTNLPSDILQLAANFLGGFVSGLTNFGLIILTTIFFLVEALTLPDKMKSVAPHGAEIVRPFLRLISHLREYMAINALVALLAAVLNVIVLMLLGVDYAILWGTLSFFLSFVPTIGFAIALVPPAIMALIQFGLTRMLIVILAYGAINFLADNFVKPSFIERGVNISMTVTYLSLVIWGWVLGPIGAILAVPIALIIQALLASREETEWLAYLMGSGSEPFSPKSGADASEATEGS